MSELEPQEPEDGEQDRELEADDPAHQLVVAPAKGAAAGGRDHFRRLLRKLGWLRGTTFVTGNV